MEIDGSARSTASAIGFARLFGRNVRKTTISSNVILLKGSDLAEFVLQSRVFEMAGNSHINIEIATF